MKLKFSFITLLSMFYWTYSSAQISITLPSEGCLTCGSSGTLPGDPAACTGATINGTYGPGAALDGSQTVDVQVNVTTIGDYVIATDAINGYVFTAVGTFATMGVQTVTLTGTGMPIAVQTNNFTVSYAGSSCNFDITTVSGNCTTPTSCSVTSSAGSIIGAGSSSNFGFSGGLPSNIYSWSITPSTGVSTSSGTGSSTGNITFNTEGTFTIAYDVTNSNSPVSCSTSTNSSCTSLTLTVSKPLLPVGGFADCTNYSTGVVEVTSPFTGRVWMDRNLGASRAATDNNDYFSYGCLFAWGRQTDGHEIVTWTDFTTPILTSRITTLSSSITPGHSNWINNSGYGDWLVSPRNDLWQGLNGLNNPCPTGFRLPTRAEFEAETTNFGGTPANHASSFLKLPDADNRRSGDGSNSGVNVGHYWTSTIGNSNLVVESLYFQTYSDQVKSHGASVRCIKN